MSPILRALKAASVIRICFALLLGFLSAFPVLASFTPAAGTNTFTAVASDAARSATHIVVANFPSTVTYAYDHNGNLTSDGQRGYAYDDENQLTSVTLTNVIKSEFTYDGWRRLRLKQDYQWAASAWQQTNQIQYVYDGSLVIQERCFDPRVSSVQPVKLISYTRGVDLSGGLQGAGGIGGLLARTEQAGTSTHLYYHSDLGGNITALVNTNDVVVGRYQYDPYGNVSMMSGEAAESNTYRFSSKAYDSYFDLYYYGYRFYVPALQRWLNRDPLGDPAFLTMRNLNGKQIKISPVEMFEGPNLYQFVSNNPLSSFDPFGLAGDSVTATIEACMKLPTPAARAACLENLLGDVSFNERNANLVKNALKNARNQCGKESFKDKASHELSEEVSKAGKDWIKGKGDMPPCRSDLEKLREIARRAIEAGKDTSKEIQKDRLRRIDDALDELLE